jgi:fructosamine-3-kinase
VFVCSDIPIQVRPAVSGNTLNHAWHSSRAICQAFVYIVSHSLRGAKAHINGIKQIAKGKAAVKTGDGLH